MVDKLFFITGRGRSGTWLLQSVLDHHKMVSVAPESIFIELFGTKYGKINKWNQATKLAFINDLKQDVKLRDWWKLDFERLKEKIVKLPSNSSFLDVCLTLYQLYSDTQKKKEATLYGDKNPEYSLRISSLLKKIPSTKFIILIRDPRDNVSSYQNVNFDLDDELALAARWNYYIDEIRKAFKLYSDCILLVRFEDMVQNPKDVLNNICTFLEIEYSDELLNFYKYSKNVFEWNKKVREPFDKSAIYKWEKQGPTLINRKITQVCKANLVHFGYKTLEPVKLNIKDYWNIIKGILTSKLEQMFYSFPLWFKLIVLHKYRKSKWLD